MHGGLPAPRAELLEFNLALDGFLVLVNIVIPPLADRAPKRD